MEKIYYLEGEFKDYEGKIRKCIIAASSYNYSVYFGIAIKHTKDKYNLEIGKKIALERARTNSYYSIGSDYNIYEDTITGTMKSLLKMVSKNPNEFIKGYNQQKEKFLRKYFLNEKIEEANHYLKLYNESIEEWSKIESKIKKQLK